MMGGQLVANCDFRPFFIRAVENLRAGGYPEQKVQELVRELGKITVDVAMRYYSAVKVANLEIATCHVCGLISLALLEKSKGDLFLASTILLEEGPTELGKVGWKMLLALTEAWEKQGLRSLRKKEWEKEAFELVSAEADKRWVGWLLYKHELAAAKMDIGKAEVLNFLATKHFSVSRGTLRVRHVRDLVETGILCEAAGIKFHQALSLTEVRDLVSYYFRQGDRSLDTLAEVTINIERKISVELRPAFGEVVMDFYRNLVEPLSEAISDSKDAISHLFVEKLVISDSADAGIKAIFREEAKGLAGKDIQDLLDDLATMPNAPEASDVYREVVRSALIAELAKRIKKFQPKEIADFICSAQSEELAGKIRWHLLNWEMVEEAFLLLGLKGRERFMLDDMLLAAKSSASGKLWWSKRTPSMEYQFRQHGYKFRTKKPRQNNSASDK